MLGNPSRIVLQGNSLIIDNCYQLDRSLNFLSEILAKDSFITDIQNSIKNDHCQNFANKNKFLQIQNNLNRKIEK